ncbi:MAG: DUF2946 domain-containing protein [Rhizobacter sp.]
MSFYRHCWKFFLHIALIAMVGVVLVPTLSQALRPAAGTGPGAVVCSTAGARWLASAAQTADTSFGGPPVAPSRPVGLHTEHCPLCSQFSSALGMPPADAACVLGPEGVARQPTLYPQSPRALFVWAPRQSRAPPPLVPA